MPITSLKNTPLEVLKVAHNKAHEDYDIPFQLSLEQLNYLLKRRSGQLSESFASFEGEHITGFILNGIRTTDSNKTAYNTGTGVLTTHRRQGIASEIFKKCIPHLKDIGISNYILEVISENTKAIELYKKFDFKITREFDYYVFQKRVLKTRLLANFEIKPLKNVHWEQLKTFWDIQPSWQNSMESVETIKEHLSFLGAYINNQFVGYGIIENQTGDIAQLAVHKAFRKQGIGSHILQKLMETSTSERIKIINVDTSNNAFKKFMKHHNLDILGNQYEMLLKL